MKKPMFIVTKLGRRSNPEGGHGNVYDGIQMCGCSAQAMVPTARMIELYHRVKKDENDEEAKNEIALLQSEYKCWEQQADFQPKIGFAVKFLANKMDAGYLRTSAIRSYYKHMGDSSDHPDKLVLPAEFPEDDLYDLAFPEMKEGDYLLATANSIYFVQNDKNKTKRKVRAV